MVGSQSVMLVLGVVLLLFGGKKLPELASSLGKSMREFKKAVESGHGDEAAPASKPDAVIAAPARACESCKAPLQAEWTHCPRCGAAAAHTSAPAA